MQFTARNPCDGSSRITRTDAQLVAAQLKHCRHRTLRMCKRSVFPIIALHPHYLTGQKSHFGCMQYHTVR